MPDPAQSPVWFITGCSTGFGRSLAQRVIARGYRCVVTARDVDKVRDLVASHSDTALAVALDVNDPAQRDAAVARAESTFGSIDVLVNNAGYGYLAAVEEGEDDQVREMFETNFFSLVALTRKVLPGMRKRRRGHVINISSIGGLVGNPSSGYYNATKFALEGLTQSLALEVASFGIKATLIEPGPFRTEWAGRSLRVPATPMPEYAQIAGARRTQMQKDNANRPGDPDRAADAIIKVFESDAPPLHLLLGKNALDRYREKLRTLQASIDQWESVTLSADGPPADKAQPAR